MKSFKNSIGILNLNQIIPLCPFRVPSNNSLKLTNLLLMTILSEIHPQSNLENHPKA